MQIDVSKAKTISPDPVAGTPLPARTRAGVNLTIFVLCIVAGYLLIFLGSMFYRDIDGADFVIKNFKTLSLTDSTSTQQVQTLVNTINSERKAYREFWAQNNQMILLNLLLPVLTALLGYIFGSKEDRT